MGIGDGGLNFELSVVKANKSGSAGNAPTGRPGVMRKPTGGPGSGIGRRKERPRHDWDTSPLEP